MIVQVAKAFMERFKYSLFKLTMQRSGPESKGNYSDLNEAKWNLVLSTRYMPASE